MAFLTYETDKKAHEELMKKLEEVSQLLQELINIQKQDITRDRR